MPAFLPGRELSRRFYHEAVRPLLDEHFPAMPYAAAHLGKGSDVLGFDTEMSQDHDWGPSLHILLRDEDVHLAENIRTTLGQHLPYTFYGYSVHFVDSAAEPGKGVTHQQEIDEGPVNHRVASLTLRAFFHDQLLYDIDREPDVAEWLTFPAQALREVTAGAVHYDGIGELTALRERLAWYPHDIWLYLLACGWQRIGQEEHLMSRAGFVGDELGSTLIGSRLVRDVMRLCFLMEKQYAPYPKWFGTAFTQLGCADRFLSVLWSAQQASTWQERETALCEAYTLLACMHNALGLTSPMPETPVSFFGRPFTVIYGSAFAQALIAQITDPAVKRIAARRLIGSVDQFSDSTDLCAVTSWRPILRQLYQ